MTLNREERWGRGTYSRRCRLPLLPDQVAQRPPVGPLFSLTVVEASEKASAQTALRQDEEAKRKQEKTVGFCSTYKTGSHNLFLEFTPRQTRTYTQGNQKLNSSLQTATKKFTNKGPVGNYIAKDHQR